MDFSVYEKRQLAVLERQLSSDRRLVAMLGAFDAHGSALRKRVHCQLIRLRHRPQTAASKPARIAVVVAVIMNVLGPAALITSLILGLPWLSVVAVGLLPFSPIMLVLAQHWVRRSARKPRL